MKILDVGSGLSQKRNVNVDIRRSVKPDVIASVNCLPFQDRSNKPSPDTSEWWRHSNTDVMHRTFWAFWKPILIRTNFTYFKPFFLFSRPLSLTVTLRKEVTFG